MDYSRVPSKRRQRTALFSCSMFFSKGCYSRFSCHIVAKVAVDYQFPFEMVKIKGKEETYGNNTPQRTNFPDSFITRLCEDYLSWRREVASKPNQNSNVSLIVLLHRGQDNLSSLEVDICRVLFWTCGNRRKRTTVSGCCFGEDAALGIRGWWKKWDEEENAVTRWFSRNHGSVSQVLAIVSN